MCTPTDPRFQRSRDAIIKAARELLTREGPGAVTHVRVAEHAGIGRATVYRHWPRADELLAEAMVITPMPFFENPTTPTQDWLLAELTAIARQLEHGTVRAVTTTLANAALWNADMSARLARFADSLTDRLAGALIDAEVRGEIVLHLTPASAAAQAIGPIFYRSIIERRTVEQSLISSTIDALGVWQ